jgi:hypothetical protein
VAELPGDSILPGERLTMKCTLSTAGRISDRAGGEIWIAYRFSDSEEEDTSPMYVRLILTAVVDSSQLDFVPSTEIIDSIQKSPQTL